MSVHYFMKKFLALETAICVDVFWIEWPQQQRAVIKSAPNKRLSCRAFCGFKSHHNKCIHASLTVLMTCSFCRKCDCRTLKWCSFFRSLIIIIGHQHLQFDIFVNFHFITFAHLYHGCTSHHWNVNYFYLPSFFSSLCKVGGESFGSHILKMMPWKKITQ